MTLADDIRRFVSTRYIEAARRAGRNTATVRAGDVVRDMGLNNRTPAVCGALGSQKFQDREGLQLLERKGPYESTTTEFRYAFVDRATTREATPPAPAKPPPARKEPRHVAAVPAELPEVDCWLVSCVRRKRAAKAKAKDLYTSDWFRKARACVERTGRPWRILSALHGLVHPETVVAPYEKTLRAMPAEEREAWARAVLADIETDLAGARRIAILAGQPYREFLEPALRARGFAVSVPMAGLKIGEQLSWLGRRLHD